jgi:hypothetical protein
MPVGRSKDDNSSSTAGNDEGSSSTLVLSSIDDGFSALDASNDDQC